MRAPAGRERVALRGRAERRCARSRAERAQRRRARRALERGRPSEGRVLLLGCLYAAELRGRSRQRERGTAIRRRRDARWPAGLSEPVELVTEQASCRCLREGIVRAWLGRQARDERGLDIGVRRVRRRKGKVVQAVAERLNCRRRAGDGFQGGCRGEAGWRRERVSSAQLTESIEARAHLAGRWRFGRRCAPGEESKSSLLVEQSEE